MIIKSWPKCPVKPACLKVGEHEQLNQPLGYGATIDTDSGMVFLFLTHSTAEMFQKSSNTDSTVRAARMPRGCCPLRMISKNLL